MTQEKTIEILEDLWRYEKVKYTDQEVREAIDMAIEALQERKTGKWIITARNGILCSECKSGTRKMPMLFGNPLYKYCPFCGAKMKGVET